MRLTWQSKAEIIKTDVRSSEYGLKRIVFGKKNYSLSCRDLLEFDTTLVSVQ